MGESKQIVEEVNPTILAKQIEALASWAAQLVPLCEKLYDGPAYTQFKKALRNAINRLDSPAKLDHLRLIMEDCENTCRFVVE